MWVAWGCVLCHLVNCPILHWGFCCCLDLQTGAIWPFFPCGIQHPWTCILVEYGWTFCTENRVVRSLQAFLLIAGSHLWKHECFYQQFPYLEPSPWLSSVVTLLLQVVGVASLRYVIHTKRSHTASSRTLQEIGSQSTNTLTQKQC